tara:strand:- start:73 stop:1299 length:1227 start_codon:yes stop_codon:yes gene_type:complete
MSKKKVERRIGDGRKRYWDLGNGKGAEELEWQLAGPGYQPGVRREAKEEVKEDPVRSSDGISVEGPDVSNINVGKWLYVAGVVALAIPLAIPLWSRFMSWNDKNEFPDLKNRVLVEDHDISLGNGKGAYFKIEELDVVSEDGKSVLYSSIGVMDKKGKVVDEVVMDGEARLHIGKLDGKDTVYIVRETNKGGDTKSHVEVRDVVNKGGKSYLGKSKKLFDLEGYTFGRTWYGKLNKDGDSGFIRLQDRSGRNVKLTSILENGTKLSEVQIDGVNVPFSSEKLDVDGNSAVDFVYSSRPTKERDYYSLVAVLNDGKGSLLEKREIVRLDGRPKEENFDRHIYRAILVDQQTAKQELVEYDVSSGERLGRWDLDGSVEFRGDKSDILGNPLKLLADSYREKDKGFVGLEN